jgi:tetratricopeptide (TPR) repeat protein
MLVARSSLLFYRVQLYLFFKQHRRALEALEALLQEDPTHQRAWSIAGFLYTEANALDKAIPAFEHAVGLNPKDAATAFNFAFALQRAGRHDEAIARFQQAIDLDPSIDRAWYGMGVSLVQRGRYREAIEKLNEAARLQPLSPFAPYQRAAAWFKLGEHEKVRSEYRKVKGFDPIVAEHIRVDFGVPKEPD